MTNGKEEKEKKIENKAKIVEVSTATAPAYELETGEIVDGLELQMRIYNLLLEIKKSLV